MAEEKIILQIDSEGKISAQTQGFKGEICLKELEKLLDGIAEIQDVKKTDDYFAKQTTTASSYIQRKQS